MKVENLEQRQRINFLFQAAHLMENMARKNSCTEKAEIEQFTILSRSFIREAHTISSKNLISLDRSIKNESCKRCYSMIIENENNFSIRFKKGRKIITCHNCGYQKRFCLR